MSPPSCFFIFRLSFTFPPPSNLHNYSVLFPLSAPIHSSTTFSPISKSFHTFLSPCICFRISSPSLPFPFLLLLSSYLPSFQLPVLCLSPSLCSDSSSFFPLPSRLFLLLPFIFLSFFFSSLPAFSTSMLLFLPVL